MRFCFHQLIYHHLHNPFLGVKIWFAFLRRDIVKDILFAGFGKVICQLAPFCLRIPAQSCLKTSSAKNAAGEIFSFRRFLRRYIQSHRAAF